MGKRRAPEPVEGCTPCPLPPLLSLAGEVGWWARFALCLSKSAHYSAAVAQIPGFRAIWREAL